MLFAGWEVRIMKNCDRGLQGRGHSFFCKFLKNNETSLAGTITTMFSSKIVNDLTESIIHSHRRLIYVRRFTFVH